MVNNFITSEHIPIIIFILSFPLSVTFITQMSNPSNPVTLYSQKKKYTQHRKQISNIMTKSSPVFKKKAQQDSLMMSRHNNQDKTSKFKNKEMDSQITRKNKLIMNKILSLSHVKKMGSSSSMQYKNRLQNNKSSLHRQSIKLVDQQNSKFVQRLTSVKSTINNNKQNSSYYEHRRRSQMLSRFTISSERGGKSVYKTQHNIKSRIKLYLQPIEKKLKMKNSPRRQVTKPLSFNSMKLQRMHKDLGDRLQNSKTLNSRQLNKKGDKYNMI